MANATKETLFRDLLNALDSCPADYKLFLGAASTDDLGEFREMLVDEGREGIGTQGIDRELARRV